MRSRREYLKSGVGLGAFGLVSATAADEAKSPRVDTHLHCFAGANGARFPYHERAPYRPVEPATPQQLLACMDGAGVDFAIVVHPEPYQEDHRYLEHCLEVGGGRLKGTCLFFSDRHGSVKKLPELVKRAPIVAARVHAYAPGRLPPFGKPELRNLWKTAGELGLAVQIHFEPRYAPGFEPMIEEFPDTRVIIDHLGRPFQATPEEHEVVVRWSRFENTVMKLSSIPFQTKYPHRDIAPVIKRLVSEFGADRMIYGGGFNAEATPESYRAAFDRAESFIAHLPPADRAKILGGNAAKLFKFS
ncbi:MAG: putative TIM-barrel fold metal-dependent hydrolase [Verrucomicrobiales bacterium]|jgi:predicted TIM-barrel fold metal-dependent hydrolase